MKTELSAPARFLDAYSLLVEIRVAVSGMHCYYNAHNSVNDVISINIISLILKCISINRNSVVYIHPNVIN